MTTHVPAAEFEVAWPSPEDPELSWFRDEMHFPAPLTPLSASFLTETFAVGTARVAEELQLPFWFRSLAVSGYVYNTAAPAATPQEMPARTARHEALIADRMDTLRERWDREYRPACERVVADLDAVELERDPIGGLDAVVEGMQELWRLHFLIVFPKLAACERFAAMYAASVPEADEMEPYRALQGEPNKSLEADRALWDLSQEARRTPGVAEALGLPSAEALPVLEATAEGRAWREAFSEFLAEYGHRSASFDLTSPTWVEDPTFALDNLRRFLAADAEDPEGQRERHLRERDELVATARARLAGDPGALAAFDGALAAARAAWPLEEDHAFYIDQRGYNDACRRAFLRLGAALVGRGRLYAREDVMYLDLPALRAALPENGDLREAARDGRRRHAGWALLDPPPLIGAPPDPTIPPDPGLVKFFGRPGPPEVEGATIRGSAGSAGVAEGVARVVRDVGELGRLTPGEVLVCRATTPPWTPIFGSIAALVTDTGGVLAHGAIVAREYGIPAVMGTKVGTAVIPDGARVRVDGTRGEVAIVG
jgi:pyruvate,water dikinase